MNQNWNVVPELLKDQLNNVIQIAVYDLHADAERCVIILEQDPEGFFEKLTPLSGFSRKYRLPVPLIITREFIQSSLDSYPLEFLNMRSDYKNIMAREDLLSKLSFNQSDIRLQMERELKSKWLLTRQGILESPKNMKSVWKIMHLSLESLMPVLKGLLFLSVTDIPASHNEVFKIANEKTVFDISPIKAVKNTSAKTLTLKLVYSYLDALSAFTTLMESWSDAKNEL